MRARVVVAAVVAMCLIGGIVAGTPSFAQPEGVTADRVLVRADVAPDGDATLTVEYRILLDDANATTAFEHLQADVRENTTRYRDRFASRLARTARTAENATGRDMAIENVTVAARTRFDGQYGVLTYRADWRGFATVDDGAVRVGDALAGYYLTENATLQVEVPGGFAVASVAPEADDTRDGVVVWNGELAFATDRPEVVARDPNAGSLVPTWLLAASALVLATTAAGLYHRRRTSDDPAIARESPGFDADDESSPANASHEASTLSDSSEDVAASGGSSDDAVASAGSSEDVAASKDDVDPELLSNEELVERTLRAAGGRMKQQVLVDALDWSETKTSHVVSDMREANRLDSFRIGRENVLVLPEADDGVFER